MTIQMTNQQFAKKDEHFRKCCEAVKIGKKSLQPTSRQASKFRNGKGLAFTKGRLILKAQAMHAQGE